MKKNYKIQKTIRKKLMQIIIEKCVNILIWQVSFINILKDSAVKTIKTVKIAVWNHRKKNWNAKCIKLPNYRYKENVSENLQNLFKKYFKISFFGR